LNIDIFMGTVLSIVTGFSQGGVKAQQSLINAMAEFE
jgi:hypothetical protein